MNGTVNPGQSTRAAAADLGVDQSTVVRARRGAEASPETVKPAIQSVGGAARLGCDRLTGICTLYDFPKNVHYPVGCYRDGGETANGAEPGAGRAKQHLSESTDTKTEC